LFQDPKFKVRRGIRVYQEREELMALMDQTEQRELLEWKVNEDFPVTLGDLEVMS